jgi:hypothetical protein
MYVHWRKSTNSKAKTEMTNGREERLGKNFMMQVREQHLELVSGSFSKKQADLYLFCSLKRHPNM